MIRPSLFPLHFTKAETIYVLELPANVKALLLFFNSIVSVGVPLADMPLKCLGAEGYAERLFFFFVAPIVFLALLFAAHLLKTAIYDGRIEYALKQAPHTISKNEIEELSSYQSAGSMRAALPVLLHRALLSATPSASRFLFVCYPLVTTVAFNAFACHDFGGDGQWLMADVAIRCGSDEHKAAMLLAWLTVLVYPIGLLLFTAVLLGYCKDSITGVSPPTKLSATLHFVYSSYSPLVSYWELFEMVRRFLLVGIAVIMWPGTIPQLSFATLFSLIFLMAEHQMAPYANPSDNFAGLAASFSIVVFFFSCILLKLGLLTDLETIQSVISHNYLKVFSVPSGALTVIMFTSVVLALVVAAFTISAQIRNQQRRAVEASLKQTARRLRWQKDDTEVSPPEIPKNEYHLVTPQRLDPERIAPLRS